MSDALSRDPPDRAPSPSPEEPDADLDYSVDAEDRIVAVEEEWERFARSNAAPGLAGALHGRSLWDFISDPTTRELYRDMLKRVRAGTPIRIPFRCDAPDRRRFMELQVVAEADGTVHFHSHLLRLEWRDPVELLGSGPRNPATPPLNICSWCKHVEVEEEWIEVEEAVERLELFGDHPPPLLSHGICPSCEKGMNEALD